MRRYPRFWDGEIMMFLRKKMLSLRVRFFRAYVRIDSGAVSYNRMNEGKMQQRRFIGALIVLATAMSATAFAQLTFQAEEFDFGMVQQNEMKNHEFAFTNSGSDTVVLSQPRASCGCTAALLSNSVIPPGGAGKISVQFRAYAGMLGRVEKTVQVYRILHREEVLMLNLKIIANVVGELLLDTTIVRFQAMVGEEKALTIRLRSNSDHPLKLDNISLAVMEYIDTTAGNTYHAESVIGKPLTDYTLTVTEQELLPRQTAEVRLLVRTHDKGQINGHLRIVLPNSEIRLPVVGVVLRN
jgi:hypothetical protein